MGLNLRVMMRPKTQVMMFNALVVTEPRKSRAWAGEIAEGLISVT